jgi:Ni,Fe-hydrogenase III small subunit
MNELEAARRASIWVASLHTGGCGACAQSVAALEATRYAHRLRALGVTLTPSLRQADVVLLCGALNEQSHDIIASLIEAAPRPRALVAVGDCAINGCVFSGSPTLTTPLAETLAVNVEIGGCPPSPNAILDAIDEARRLLATATEETGETDEAEETEEAGETALASTDEDDDTPLEIEAGEAAPPAQSSTKPSEKPKGSSR